MNILFLIKDFLVKIGRSPLKAGGVIFNFQFSIFKKRHRGIIFSQKRRWFRKYRWRIIDVVCFVVIFLSITITFYEKIIRDLPNVNLIYNLPNLSSKVLDRNDKVLFKFYENEDRSWVPFDKLPKSLIEATIAVEDKEFYSHQGVSIKGILTAIWYDLRHRGQVRGGSTITQQLVKNVFLSNEKSIKRKLQELILAHIVETKLSKNEILERYLNQVAYGGETYGVQEAALKYFGKDIGELSNAQTAFLAGLPASPTTYVSSEKAMERQKHVIDQMVAANSISKDEGEKLKNENINVTFNRINIKAPHFVFYVRDYVLQKFNIENFSRAGMTIHTSLDIDLQKESEKIVKEEISKVKNLNISNGAALVINVRTGDILAMVGSVNGDYNVVTALRQPGSSIKPINYLLALEKGMSINSTIEDSPISYVIKGQKPYSPQNYGGKYFGTVTLKTALASSLNIPSVKLLAANGVNEMRELGIKMGITTWNDPSRFGLSLALGGNEVKMIDLAKAYSTFANLGEMVEINPILKIENYLDEEIYHKTVLKEKIIKDDYAYIINWVLTDNIARSPVFGLNSKLKIDGKTVAVKTGTTNNLRDNWCIGWTPTYLVAVWVGNNDNSSMNRVASGISGATPIWNRIMTYLIKDKPDEKWNASQELIDQLNASRSSQPRPE